MGYNLNTKILIAITISMIVLLVFPLAKFWPIIVYSQFPYLPNQGEQHRNSSSPLSKGNQGTTFNYTGLNDNKVAIITFGDAWKSQFTTAKPILDKYGFKASFFIPCNYPDKKKTALTWQDIAGLQNDGMDIQSKGMNDILVTDLSASALEFEVGQSKQCLLNHGVDAIAFATPHGEGSKNATVVNAIGKYYDLAINGFSNLMFLHCDGWKQNSTQTDCRTFDDAGNVTYANKYVIREWSHNVRDRTYSHNDTKIFQIFVQEVNNQTKYNHNGLINAIPILAYHKIDNLGTSQSTNIALFDREMKYLRDNGFRVITLSDLGYNENNNSFYVKTIGKNQQPK
jgi:peptidoglycan/xylan/chitin deacetylase (PgdA/CDA1 family)